jgi:type III pantothenate kinase
MTLAVDIGNTNIVCGVYRNDVLIWHSRFKTDRNRTSDEYFSFLSSLKRDAFSFEQINRIAIASVVPDMTRMWQHMFEKYFEVKAIVINGYSPLGLTFVTDDPGFIGADLITNAFAAWQKYKTTCIIVDFGTATTIQLVTADGKFMGAIIAPGIKTGSAELFDKAALLSEIELITPQYTLGTNTNDALLSGIIKGHALMIDNFIKQLNIEYAINAPIKAIATGGIADLIVPLIPAIDILDKTLTLDGLHLASLSLTNR